LRTAELRAVFTNGGGKAGPFSGSNSSKWGRTITSGCQNRAVSSDGLLGNKDGRASEIDAVDLVNTSREEGLPLGLTSGRAGPALPDGNWEVDKEEVRLSGRDEKGGGGFFPRPCRMAEDRETVQVQWRSICHRSRLGDSDIPLKRFAVPWIGVGSERSSSRNSLTRKTRLWPKIALLNDAR